MKAGGRSYLEVVRSGERARVRSWGEFKAYLGAYPGALNGFEAHPYRGDGPGVSSTPEAAMLRLLEEEGSHAGAVARLRPCVGLEAERIALFRFLLTWEETFRVPDSVLDFVARGLWR